MDIYKTRRFKRWADKERLGDEWLRLAVREMSDGLFEANLGGNLIKKRIARPGHGKRGGLRTIVATRLRDQWFFVYGFAKNERDNIGRDEEAALKKLAATLLKMPAPALARALDAGEVMEATCDA